MEFTERLRGIFYRPAKFDTEPIEPVEKTKLSPWETDLLLTENIKAGFTPDIYRGQSGFLPIPDQGRDGKFLCAPTTNEKGEVRPAVWLDPKKWTESLAEFSHMAERFGDGGIKFVVIDHTADAGEFESILIRPVLIDRYGDYQESQSKFSLTADGRVSLIYSKLSFDSRGKPERVIAVKDLGLLNPERVTRRRIEDIKKVLSNPPILSED